MQSVNMTPLLLQVLYEYKKNNETAMERFGEFLTSNALEKHVYDFSTFEIDNDLETNNVQQVTLQACYNSKYLTSKTGLFCVLANSLYLFAIENGSYRCWKVCDIDNNGYAVKSGQPIDTLETGTVNDLRSQYFGVADQGSSYTLPTASASTLGGVKVGNNLTIDATTGVLNAESGGSSVSTADFDSAKPQLNGLNIDGTVYKLLDVKVNDGINLIIGKNRTLSSSGVTDAFAIGDCDNSTASRSYSTAIGNNSTASGDSSTAIGNSSTASRSYSTASGYSCNASGNNSTAIGNYCNASDNYSTASGYYCNASGNSSTAIGNKSTASGDSSTAIGYYSIASIAHEYSIISKYGNNPRTNSSVYSICDISHVFFANLADGETGWIYYTSFSQFAKGHFLKEYLGCGEVTAVTETMANIIANTSDYFDTTGTGTSEDPFIVTPKTLDSQPHNGRLYKIALTSTGKYVTFQSSNNEKCVVELTGTTSSTDVIAFKNISGKVRHGVNFLSGASGYILNIPINTDFVADIDVNSPDMWQLSD